MPKIGYKQTQIQKDKNSATNTARWKRAKQIVYEADAFDMNAPLSAILECLNSRSEDGWEKDEIISRKGIVIFYKKTRKEFDNDRGEDSRGEDI